MGSSGFACIIVVLLLLGIGGPTTYVVVVREQSARQGGSTTKASFTSPTTISSHSVINGITVRAVITSPTTSMAETTSSGFQTHTKAARDTLQANYFKFDEKVMEDGNTFIAYVQETMKTYPGSQHDLLASLLHESCQANTPEARRLDYDTDTCPFMTEAFIATTKTDWREIARKNFLSVAQTSSKEWGSVGRYFCDALFPPGWAVGVRQTRLTRAVEADCEVGRMREMEERRGRGVTRTVG